MVLQLDAKDVGDIVAIAEDDAFWLELGEVEKAAMRPSAVAMMKAGSDASLDTLTVATGPAFIRGVDAAIQTNVDSYLDDWWSALEKTDRNQLRTSLQAFANGEVEGGFPALRRDVEGIFGQVRGKMIAETETTRLWALGTDTTLAEAGVAEYEWRTVNDPLVDQPCADRDGKRYKVGSGILPPLHPRCRCAIIGVLTEPAAPTEGFSEELNESLAEQAAEPAETDAEREERERQQANAEMMARFNASQTATPAATSDPPMNLGSIRAAPGKTGRAKVRADAVNRTANRHLAAWTPEERAALERNGRSLHSGGAGKNAGTNNTADGRISFNQNLVDSEIKPWSDNPLLIAEDSAQGALARSGFNTIEHELTHSVHARTASYQAQQGRATVKRVNQVANQKNVKIIDGDWPDVGLLQDNIGVQIQYNGGNGWSAGTRIEEGLTDARARDRLRLRLIDQHGLTPELATAWSEEAVYKGYDGYVHAMRNVADEALDLVGPQFASIMEGRALDVARRESAAWTRAWGGTARFDRADMMARYFMEKWTVEIGPIAARGAGGEILGMAHSQEFYAQFVSGVKGSLGSPFGPLLSQRRLQNARKVWAREAASFADDLAAANLRPDVDGVLALRGEWASAADLPEGMAKSLPRRADVLTSEVGVPTPLPAPDARRLEF